MRSLLAILVLLPMLSMAQGNLVPNGGFEYYCPNLGPNGAEVWNVEPWDNIVEIGGGADAYNSCAQLLINQGDTNHIYNIPTNGVGYQNSFSGDGYVGFYAVSDPESYPNWREFIQTPLTEPLQVGVRYEVVFHVSLADKFQYAVGSLGAHFSINPLSEVAYDILPEVVPQIRSPAGVIYNDKENWMEVRDTLYIPRSEDGGQQWMTIGNFLPDSLSQITFVDSGAAPNLDRSYYYIDDVSVIALDSVPSGMEEQEELGFEIWPNPVTDVLRFRVLDSSARASVGMTVRVVDAVGREILRQGSPPGKEGSGEVDISPLPKGIYLLELTDREGKRAVRRFVKE